MAGALALALGVAVVCRAQQGGKPPGAGGKPPVPGRADPQDQSVGSVVEGSTYVIGPDDVLDISVWKEPDFSRVVPVRPDGKISLPLVRDIQAAGLTPIQLGASITVVLRKYVTQPQVTVIVTQINSQRVYILGEVIRPGPLSLLPKMTVLQAIASAGGPSPFAKQREIYVLRNDNGKQNRYPFNYREVIRGRAAQQDITLRAGDTIVVP